MLRSVAGSVADLGHLLPHETGDVLVIVGQLARLAAHLQTRGTALHQLAAGGAARAFQGFTGLPGDRETDVLRRALPARLAADVVRDPAWPALAAAVRRLDSTGHDAASLLRTTASSRELDSTRSVAGVLHHRLTHAAAERQPARSPTEAVPGRRVGRTRRPRFRG